MKMHEATPQKLMIIATTENLPISNTGRMMDGVLR
jgi:hypothetical protein